MVRAVGQRWGMRLAWRVARRGRARRRRDRAARRVLLDGALLDARLDPAVLLDACVALLDRELGDPAGGARVFLLGAGPAVEWCGLAPPLRRVGEPVLRVVGVRADRRPPRVVVEVRVRLATPAPWPPAVAGAVWQLELDGAAWTLREAVAGTVARAQLREPLIGGAWAGEGVRDAVTIQLAEADGGALVALAPHGDPHARLLDAALDDPRCAPDVLAAVVRDIARAWEAASNGDRAALAAVATDTAARALMAPTPNGRRRVAGLEVQEVHVTDVGSGDGTTVVEVLVSLRGRRWLVDRHSAGATAIAGSERRARAFVERWRLALPARPHARWRLVATGSRRARRGAASAADQRHPDGPGR
jgi:hypothetical protein